MTEPVVTPEPPDLAEIVEGIAVETGQHGPTMLRLLRERHGLVVRAATPDSPRHSLTSDQVRRVEERFRDKAEIMGSNPAGWATPDSPPEPPSLTEAALCGAVMATCRNEPGHPDDHWHPEVRARLVAGVPGREPGGVEPRQGGLTDLGALVEAAFDHAHQPDGYVSHDMAADYLARALASSPPPPDLDTRRLALALMKAVGNGWMRATPGDPVQEWFVNAENVAREYAALASHPPSTPREPTDD